MPTLRALNAGLFALLLSACASGTSRLPQPLHDPEVQAWIEARVRTLAGEHPPSVELWHSPATQATLYPNGHLTIRSALLLRLRDESEITFVLAHELAHHDLGHFMRRTEPDWDARAAEHQADLAAAQQLAQMGLRTDAGISLLTALEAELAMDSDADQEGLDMLSERLRLLQEAGRAPAHAPPARDTWRALMDSRWEAWFVEDPAAKDPERALIVRTHAQRPAASR
jgi:predicted Zn-dependent protease